MNLFELNAKVKELIDEGYGNLRVFNAISILQEVKNINVGSLKNYEGIVEIIKEEVIFLK